MEFYSKIISKQEIEEVTDLLTKAYGDDPVFRSVFRRRSPRQLLKTVTLYYVLYEHILIAKDGERIVGVILWNGVNSKSIKISDFIKGNLIGTLLKLILSTPPTLFCRILNWSNTVDKYHYKESDHYYLFMIASKEKGKGIGGALMKEFLKDKDLPVYLENSNKENNEAFYNKCGFKYLGSFEVYGNPNQRYLYTCNK